MSNFKNNWNILVYSLILISILMSAVYVITSKSNQFITNIETQKYNLKLNKNIQQKANLSFKYNKFLNTSWSWFTNTKSCPEELTLSGTSWTWASFFIINNIQHFFDWYNIYCKWLNASWSILIWYTNDFLSYSWVYYLYWNFIKLNSNNNYFTWILDDANSSYISFTGGLDISNIDSNFNSDNYTAYSSWSDFYPNWYIDDDVNARLEIYWYVEKIAWYFNVFWNNIKTNVYISNNINNYDRYHWLIWGTWGTDWYVKLNLDNAYNIKIIEFNRDKYNKTNELRKIKEWSWSGPAWNIWYINNSWDWLTSWTWSKMSFDFKNKDYWIFLAAWINPNTWNLLRYKIEVKNTSWYRVFINPIDDSKVLEEGVMKYLGNDIIIDNEWNFISKQTETINEE